MAKTPLNIIKLNELPKQGESFVFTSEDGKESFAPYFKDLIGDQKFHIEMHIQPAGNAYQLQGKIQTKMPLVCSLCATDIQHPVKVNLNEIILINSAMAKNEHEARANHSSELNADGPEALILDNEAFDVAEYLHEMIALAEPIRPLGTPDCETACPERDKMIPRDWLSVGNVSEKMENTNPFASLKDLKITQKKN